MLNMLENMRYLRTDRLENRSMNPLLLVVILLPTKEIRLIENATYVKLETSRRNEEHVSTTMILKY